MGTYIPNGWSAEQHVQACGSGCNAQSCRLSTYVTLSAKTSHASTRRQDAHLGSSHLSHSPPCHTCASLMLCLQLVSLNKYKCDTPARKPGTCPATRSVERCQVLLAAQRHHAQGFVPYIHGGPCMHTCALPAPTPGTLAHPVSSSSITFKLTHAHEQEHAHLLAYKILLSDPLPALRTRPRPRSTCA